MGIHHITAIASDPKLPPMYEPSRDEIERVLPPVRLPQAAVERGR